MMDDVGASMKSRDWTDARVRPLIEKVWNYHHLHHELAPADAILVLCSHDTVVAERGAQLLLDGWAPLLIFSGGLGTITKHLWQDPEADRFARIAVSMGVPEDRLLIENRSTNTGENVLFTKRLLAERQLDPDTFIVVQKPYMERRSYATFRKVWPEKQVIVTSPQVSLDAYLGECSHRALSADDVVSIMVGDLQRIRLYRGNRLSDSPGDSGGRLGGVRSAGGAGLRQAAAERIGSRRREQPPRTTMTPRFSASSAAPAPRVQRCPRPFRRTMSPRVQRYPRPFRRTMSPRVQCCPRPFRRTMSPRVQCCPRPFRRTMSPRVQCCPRPFRRTMSPRVSVVRGLSSAARDRIAP